MYGIHKTNTNLPKAPNVLWAGTELPCCIPSALYFQIWQLVHFMYIIQYEIESVTQVFSLHLDGLLYLNRTKKICQIFWCVCCIAFTGNQRQICAKNTMNTAKNRDLCHFVSNIFVMPHTFKWKTSCLTHESDEESSSTDQDQQLYRDPGLGGSSITCFCPGRCTPGPTSDSWKVCRDRVTFSHLADTVIQSDLQ